MKNELNKIIKNFSGKVLVIGYNEDDQILKMLNKNNNITAISHLTDDNKKEGKKRFSIFKEKKISIKKMYKDLKKEKYDYLIVDFNVIKKHLNSFIYNSYKLSNNKIYIILDDESFNYKELIYRYKRYNAFVMNKSLNNKHLIDIEITNMKMKVYKRILYSFRDLGYSILDFIAFLVMS